MTLKTKAKRVEHLRIEISVMSCEIVAQMLYPLPIFFSHLGLGLGRSPIKGFSMIKYRQFTDNKFLAQDARRLLLYLTQIFVT